MNNHASLYILLTFFGVAGLLVLISFLKSRGRKSNGELTPKIPYVWDIPRYNDVEERFIKLKNVWFRLFCLVVIIGGAFEAVDMYHREPLKDLPPTNEERMALYKNQAIKLSLSDMDSIAKAQTILNQYLAEKKVCNTVVSDSRKFILDNYKKSGAWIIENKVELNQLSQTTCDYVRNLARNLLRECSDSACVARIYNQINKYHKTYESGDMPKVGFNFDSFSKNEKEVKDTFSYVGWYLNNKGKK